MLLSLLLLLLSVCSYKWARTLHNRFVLQQSHITRSSRTSRLKPAAVQQNQLYSSWRQRPLACGFTCLRNAPAPAYFKRAILRTPPPSTDVHGSVQRLSSSFCCAHLRRPSSSFFECCCFSHVLASTSAASVLLVSHQRHLQPCCLEFSCSENVAKKNAQVREGHRDNSPHCAHAAPVAIGRR